MAVTVNWSTRVISVPQADLTLVSGVLYELDVDVLRLALKTIEDSDEGINFPDTHRHNTEVTLSGVTYARTFEVVNGYTVSFENTGTPYVVSCVGANHNLGDVTNFDGGMSLIIGNSAGLIVKSVGSGLSSEQDTALAAIKAKTDQLAFTSGSVQSDVKRMNGAVVVGDGTSGDKWRGA